ncbi:MAG: hypothetical protein GQ524_11685 [Anaerolineales bacterium]|nr:hypothetical protein [Anaerolineales bacterium]
MAVKFTSSLAYYEYVLSGKAVTHKQRIMKRILELDRPVTRHELFDNYFYVATPVALDGNPPIPWQSLSSRVGELTKDGYLIINHEGNDPVTGNLAEFVIPVGDKWKQRIMFD